MFKNQSSWTITFWKTNVIHGNQNETFYRILLVQKFSKPSSGFEFFHGFDHFQTALHYTIVFSFIHHFRKSFLIFLSTCFSLSDVILPWISWSCFCTNTFWKKMKQDGIVSVSTIFDVWNAFKQQQDIMECFCQYVNHYTTEMYSVYNVEYWFLWDYPT